MLINELILEDLDQIIEENNGLAQLKGKTVFITGATGMVGLYFAMTIYRLNQNFDYNCKLVLAIRTPSKLPIELQESPDVEVYNYDISLPISYAKNVDYVIHCASPASPKIMSKYPVETNFANTLGTAFALNFAKENNVDSFLFISSREIYGQPMEGQDLFYEDGPLGQVNPLIPRNGYAEGKKAAENMCVGFKEEYGLNTKIMRLAHTYGPGISIDDGRVQADFLRDILYGRDIVLKSDGSSIRTYTYISDAISGAFKIFLNSKEVVYNLADENNKVSIRELAETLVNLRKEKNLKLVFDIPESNANTGTASFTLGILSSEKLRAETGWVPKYNVEQGFDRTLTYLEMTQGN